METVVKLGGVTELVLEKLVSMGYFQTRTEALRAGVLELGKEYHVIENPQQLEDELVVRKMQRVSEEIDSGKRKTYALDDVLRDAKISRKDLK